MNAEIKLNMQGFYRIVCKNPYDEKRVLAEWFQNEIVNTGLDLFGNDLLDSVSACFVGTGNSQPQDSNTQLDVQVGSTNDVISSVSGPGTGSPAYSFCRKTFRFAEGSVSGIITEIGVGAVSGFNQQILFSRALIRDQSGFPAAVQVELTDVLEVEYELRMYPVTFDSTGNFSLNGINYMYTIRPALANVPVPGWASSSNPSTILTNPVGVQCVATNLMQLAPYTDYPIYPDGNESDTITSFSDFAFVWKPYIAGLYYRDLEINFDFQNANFENGIQGLFVVTNGGYYQVVFAPSIPKTNTKQLKVTLRIFWGGLGGT